MLKTEIIFIVHRFEVMTSPKCIYFPCEKVIILLEKVYHSNGSIENDFHVFMSMNCSAQSG